MRLTTIVALLLAAAPLTAQSAIDSTNIRNAATRFGESAIRTVRIVADTAWVRVYDPRKDFHHSHPAPGTGEAYGTILHTREVRVERRDGKWVRREKL